MRRSSLLLVGSILPLSSLFGCSGGSNPNGNSTPPTPPTSAVNAALPISSISPGSIVAGSPSQTVTFTGTGYVASTAAALNGTALQTKYVSATSLQVAVPASALASGQMVSFVASNPSPGGSNSAAASFSIMSPTPILTGLSPQTIPQGAAATVTVNGSGFGANSVVMWNDRSSVYGLRQRHHIAGFINGYGLAELWHGPNHYQQSGSRRQHYNSN